MRDFINAEEVVEILFKIYIKKITGIFNIGSGKGLTVKSFVQKNLIYKIYSHQIRQKIL